ncbi:MAG TPA: hypothetical protein DC001_05795, partial [Clostridiales bacterium]|nr:hypothetical protein [Clostridiales bacterium]
VEAIPNGGNAEYGYLTVVSSRSVGDGYGHYGYWFTIGTYKSIATARKYAGKKLADLGHNIRLT